MLLISDKYLENKAKRLGMLSSSQNTYPCGSWK